MHDLWTDDSNEYNYNLIGYNGGYSNDDREKTIDEQKAASIYDFYNAAFKNDNADDAESFKYCIKNYQTLMIKMVLKPMSKAKKKLGTKICQII